MSVHTDASKVEKDKTQESGMSYGFLLTYFGCFGHLIDSRGSR